MRISVNWLRELVEFSLTPEELAETLTIAGLEVEEIEDRRTWADGVVLGKIVQRDPHPNADKLSVCQVDIGQDEPLNIVCGAPNARKDIYVPVATVGTYLPTIDLKIKPAKLRGVPSQGMICSLAEVGLAKESAGIHIFEEESPILGQDARVLLGLDDVILDISPTANRADAMSMVGVAREVAALTGGSLTLPEPEKASFNGKSKELTLDITDNKACPIYIGTVIEGVTIAPSPEWLQTRLDAAGIRPINNVVDITNLILLEWGQPLHAFDRERLKSLGNGKDLTLGTRFAEEGEKTKTLDGQERSLKPENLVITGNNVPVAVAGVMGGEETEVYDGTKNLVLEAAIFDPIVVRRSSRCQGLRSESSARYERGVNLVALETAVNRAIELLSDLAGGKAKEQVIADARPDLSSQSIELRLERVNAVLGKVEKGDITTEDVERILGDLNCQLTSTSTNPQIWSVTIPPYRYRDLEREIDLIEEIARLYGYDRFCDTLPAKTEAGSLPQTSQIERKVREILRGVGLTELVHYSLVKPEKAEVVIANPLFAEYSALRTDLLDGLIDAFAENNSQGNTLNGFELGRIFPKKEDGVAEKEIIAAIFGGDLFSSGRWLRSGKPQPMGWYDAKGVLETVFDRLGLNITYKVDKADERLHPGRTASLWLKKQRLGTFGQLHPQLRQERDLKDEVYAFVLDFDVLLKALSKDNLITPHFQSYSTYPAVERDLAFFSDVDISVADLSKAITEAGSKLLEKVELFDEYKGENVPEGQRSLAFSLAYRSSDRTLTDAEVDPVHGKIRKALEKKFKVTLRS
ncbi:MAG: phenylalanine--tRNA ligase subunit beta [Microcystaceae cyanobacterium]